MNRNVANVVLAASVLGIFLSGRTANARIQGLLATAQKEYQRGGSVEKIVGSFALAQELIHQESWKRDAGSDPEKQVIVSQFTQLGQELSA